MISPEQADAQVLTIENLTASYGDLRVLADVGFTVAKGTLTAVLGRNGAGKTSLLNAIAGLPPQVSAGRICFDDIDLRGQPTDRRMRAGIAYVQEGKRLFGRRTVEENLLLGGFTIGSPWRLRTPGMRAALDHAYSQFPMLAERRRSHAAGLSGGQQQMLAIAQALMPRPRLLLLDEPSAGLAPAIFKEVFDLVSQLRHRGLAVLLVEQVIEPVLQIADHVLVLHNGRIAAAGPAAGFQESSIMTEVYFAGQTAADSSDPKRAAGPGA